MSMLCIPRRAPCVTASQTELYVHVLPIHDCFSESPQNHVLTLFSLGAAFYTDHATTTFRVTASSVFH